MGNHFVPDPLSNNLSWVDKIIQDSCVNGHQGAGPEHYQLENHVLRTLSFNYRSQNSPRAK